jgi:Domain of unknown function (DUF4129)
MGETRVEHHLRSAETGRLATGRWSAILAAIALALVALVGLGSGRPLWDVDGPPRLADPESYAGDAVVLGFALLAIAPLIVSALRGRRRRRFVAPEADVPPARVPWWGRVLALAAMAAVIVLSLQVLRLLPGAGPGTRQKNVSPPTSDPARTPDSSGGLPPVHWWGLAALALVLLAGAALAWRLRDGRSEPQEPEPEDEDLLTALDLSLEEIESDPDPRRAVIRAYARMEQALGAHGLARRAAETPLEYLARALTSLHVGRRSVERLTALFERAKFSQHEIDSSMKTEALAALTALRADLAEGPA